MNGLLRGRLMDEPVDVMASMTGNTDFRTKLAKNPQIGPFFAAPQQSAKQKAAKEKRPMHRCTGRFV
jgi:hypothetical protein